MAALENQPYALISLYQTLHFAQCSQADTRILATEKARLINWRQNSRIHLSREQASTALKSRGGEPYTTAYDALHCIWRRVLGLI